MVKDREKEIDDRFYIPENIIDIRRTGSAPLDDYSNIVDSESPTQYPEVSLNYEKLPTPQADVWIVEQTPRFSPDGTVTVDVVIELPSPPQYSEYQKQIAKVED